ncbi:hypothetical protein [Actinopolymorpha alba]|uniref:hypothetical protein n=1 Tax=Actinopolymorpha alba TaxID=533267 RepID=UPI00039ACB9C|nr:hypothetical protein [Actinopolymorpha alba]
MRPVRRWVSRSTVVGVSVSAATITALTIGGIALADNLAAAGTGSQAAPTPTASTQPDKSDGSTSDKVKDARLRGHFAERKGGFGIGMGGALHGEFVIPKDGGGYQTLLTQRGAVQSVSDTSITVKSDDGYTKTYAVKADTVVNATRDGIGSVKKGTTVRVVASESGDTATALRIADESALKGLRRDLMPKRPMGEERPGR